MLSFAEKVQTWFFRSYEHDKLDIERAVVARFSRGNVRVQDGHYISDAQLVDLSKRADEAMGRLEAAAN